MPDNEATYTRTRDAAGRRRPQRRGSGVTIQRFTEMFGESLFNVLAPESWRSGMNLAYEYRRVEEEVLHAAEVETTVQETIRRELFPLLNESTGHAVPGRGVHRIQIDEIRAIHDRLLFPGRVEAIDGRCEVHDTLPLTIYSLGVGLVSYHGDSNTWGTKLYRRDLRQSHGDPIEMVRDLLERRDHKVWDQEDEDRDALSDLARRAIMAFAERSVMVHQADAPWRLGHGNPCGLELLSGGGCADLTIQSIRLLCQLIDYRKFIFVASESTDRLALTIGEALQPLEFAILGRLSDRMESQVEQVSLGHEVTVDSRWDGIELSPTMWLRRFTDEYASKIVYGVYRATMLSPAQLFYAHQDYHQEAARVAMADSVLQEGRGYPLLLDLADRTCGSVYGGGNLHELTRAAFARAGEPFRYPMR